MKREYLFRGKRTDGKKWVYGDLVHHAFDGTSRTMEVGIKPKDSYPIEVIPESVGQFTGLLDKNGVKIFEHDIVSVKGTKRVGVYTTEVIYDRTLFCLKRNDTYFTDIASLTVPNLVVIGNIHDNPELL